MPRSIHLARSRNGLRATAVRASFRRSFHVDEVTTLPGDLDALRKRRYEYIFIDLDLPQALTVGDEVSIPVGVFNYLPAEQTVRLELTKQPWFELLDEAVKELKIAANEIDVEKVLLHKELPRMELTAECLVMNGVALAHRLGVRQTQP